MNDIYKPQPSNDGRTKFYVLLPSGKKLKFGDIRYEDYTIHGDDKRKEAYIKRHQAREQWSNPDTKGYWSKNLLWNKKTIRESYEDIKKDLKRKGLL
jgi:hypothetical protein